MESPNDSSWRARVADYKFTFLLVALLVLALMPAVVGASDQRSLIFRVTSVGVMLLGVLTVLQRRKACVVAAVLGVLATAAQGASFVYGTQHYLQLRLALLAAFLVFLAVVIVRDVLRAETVTWDKIQGALCAYLLFGLAWGLLYAWVGLRDPQAFSAAVDVAGRSGEPMTYYSFVTLTTLGYGDITPVNQTARTLSWLEAAFGQIYLVVLVAHLVSRQLFHSSRG